MGNKLVLIVDIKDVGILYGLRRVMSGAIHRALRAVGLGLSLEHVYEVPAAGVATVLDAAEDVSFDLPAQIVAERPSRRQLRTPLMH